MNGLNDIICTKTEEAEERNAAQAKVVEATDFQSVERGSTPLGSAKGTKEKNWNLVAMTDTIGGRDFSRLSVLQ